MPIIKKSEKIDINNVNETITLSNNNCSKVACSKFYF